MGYLLGAALGLAAVLLLFVGYGIYTAFDESGEAER